MDEHLSEWFGRNRRDLPWRRTRDPYAILVSEVMLQQTQVARVVPRYLRWLERWPTVGALAAADAAGVLPAWPGPRGHTPPPAPARAGPGPHPRAPPPPAGGGDPLRPAAGPTI